MYIVIEHCPTNHLIPIIAQQVYQYTGLGEFLCIPTYLVRNFHLNSKGPVNIHKTKIQMAYVVVHNGKLLPYQPYDAIFSM